MEYRNHILTILFGIFVGIVIALITANFGNCNGSESNVSFNDETKKYHRNELSAVTTEHSETETASYENSHRMRMEQKLKEDENGRIIDSSMADWLFAHVRILCVLFTVSKRHYDHAIHVKNVWLSRCNDRVIVSTEFDNGLGAIALLPNATGDESVSSWRRTKAAIQYVNEYHTSGIDWILMVKDDTFVVMENLRYMLYAYSADQPMAFGHRRRMDGLSNGYLDRGAYVLSRSAVQTIAHNGCDDDDLANDGQSDSVELELAKCLNKLDILFGDSRDDIGKERFFPNSPQQHLFPEQRDDPYRFYATIDGPDSISEWAIAFSNVYVAHSYAYEYLLYKLRPYGIVQHDRYLPMNADCVNGNVI